MAALKVTPEEIDIRNGVVVDKASGTERLVVVAETRERSVEAREKLAAAITAEVARSVGVPPDAVLAVPPHSIPKTSSGKLRRDRTKQLYQAGSCGAPTRAPWLQVVRLALAGLAACGFVSCSWAVRFAFPGANISPLTAPASW